MMEKVQRFGSAMLAPVLLFAFAGLAVGIAIIAQNGRRMDRLQPDGTALRDWSAYCTGKDR